MTEDVQPPATRVCKTCGKEKPLYQFVKDKTCSFGYSHRCRDCRGAMRSKDYYEKPEKRQKETRTPSQFREKHLKQTYGLTMAAYDNMAKAQDHRCSICGAHQEDLPYLLHVDHHHESGKIRELLCKNCNMLLGHAREDLSILDKAKEYLIRHKE